MTNRSYLYSLHTVFIFIKGIPRPSQKGVWLLVATQLTRHTQQQKQHGGDLCEQVKWQINKSWETFRRLRCINKTDSQRKSEQRVQTLQSTETLFVQYLILSPSSWLSRGLFWSCTVDNVATVLDDDFTVSPLRLALIVRLWGASRQVPLVWRVRWCLIVNSWICFLQKLGFFTVHFGK